MKKAYLKIERLSEGQFSDESAVCLSTFSGELTSGFIENRHIDFKEKRLEVKVIQENDKLALIQLPGRMLEFIGDKGYLTVKKSNLVYEQV